MDSLGTGAVGRPHPALRLFVNAYVGYRHQGAPAVHHGVAGPSATVILAFDEPIDTAWKDDPASRGEHWRLASGLHTRPALIHTGGSQHGIQLDLTPLGVRALLGLPVGALARALVSHDDVPLGLTTQAHEAIADATTWPQRFALLDTALLAAVTSGGERRTAAAPSAALEGWHLLNASAGRMSISALAASTGWSVRHVHTCFVAEFGVTPKQVAQLMRFERARALVARGGSLARVAAESGYADQAHLTREWTRFAGQPPRATLAELAEFAV